MDNATDALYMAFGILIFVVAISLTMSSFSLVREVGTTIINNLDKETQYSYMYGTAENEEGGTLQTSRIVGKETIIPTLYRGIIENYIVRFYSSDGSPLYIYQVYDKNADRYISTNKVDKNDGNIDMQFIDALVSGNLDNLLNNDETRYRNFKVSVEDLQGKQFYDKIVSGNKKFIETLGIYYTEDLQLNYTDDVNKTERRVITYTQVN